MGTPEPAAKCLKALIDAGEEIIAVITQPDRPKGRGLQVSGSAVKEVAIHYNIAVHQPENIKDGKTIDLIKKIAPDLIVVVAYGKILSQQLLDIPKFGTINVHASLLPKYRGAAPVQWAIMNGDSETGITIMKVTEKLDSGDIILQQNIKIDAADNTATLTGKLFDLGSDLLVNAVRQIKEGKTEQVKQDDKLATLAPQLTKGSGQIDWEMDAMKIFDQIRACYPWPVAYTLLHGKMFRIFSAEIGFAEKKRRPGMIMDFVKDEGFIVDAGSGTIFVKEVQLESGKKMHAWNFVLGHKLKVGDIFPS